MDEQEFMATVSAFLKPVWPRVEMTHLNGVPWWEAPKPRRFHRHWAQTTGWDMFTQIERCACGAIRLDGRGWMRD